MEAWEEALGRGETETAWDLFIARYRRLIINTIRRALETHEDLPDVLAEVCVALSADGLSPLRQYTVREGPRARFSTWLVVVVRNQTIDWIRRQSGRRRIIAPSSLSELQREIFLHVCAERRSHVEAYELLAAGSATGLTFEEYLRELAGTYRQVEASSARGMLRYLAPPPDIEPQPAAHPEDVVLATDARERLRDALGSLSDEVRLAVQLFVVDEVPAAEVAKVVGWRSAKDVYNRVYRALGKLRETLERRGISSGDL
jgi:RNA polymerase sigma factor (sigma-70 family)